jgi:hypothetical protein
MKPTVETSYAAHMATGTGLKAATIYAVRLEKVGLLKRRTVKTAYGKGGWVVLWTLLYMNPDVAHEKLTEWQKDREVARMADRKAQWVSGLKLDGSPRHGQPGAGPRKPYGSVKDGSVKAAAEVGRRGEEKVTLVVPQPPAPQMPAYAGTNGEETKAIVGPDAPSSFAGLAPLRKNEAYALVEAARQYTQRGTKMQEALAEFLHQAEELGLTVDDTKLQGSFGKAKKDERLESVGLVLPYITSLEQRVERLTTDLNAERARFAEFGQLKSTVASQRSHIERLIAEREAGRRDR